MSGNMSRGGVVRDRLSGCRIVAGQYRAMEQEAVKNEEQEEEEEAEPVVVDSTFQFNRRG